MKKIGIYSGTFDPVHNGHVSFALETGKLFELDRVYFLVEPRPRRKQGVKSMGHRVNMVQIAVKEHKSLGTIIIDQSQFTTRDTLPIIASRFKGAEIYMLIGDDTLDHIADWPNVDELLNSVSFIIGARQRKPYEVRAVVNKIASSKVVKIKSKVFIPSGAKYSSSQIKKELRNSPKAKSIKGLDPKILDYIKTNMLYFSAIE